MPDELKNARELINAARNYVKVFANLMCPLVGPTEVDAIVKMVGEISISAACDLLQQMQLEEEQDEARSN